VSVEKVFVYAHTGAPEAAKRAAAARYPGAELVELPQEELRGQGSRGALRVFRRLRGRALVVYYENRQDVMSWEVWYAVHLAHHCRETVIADCEGVAAVYTNWGCVLGVPRLLACAVLDGAILALAYAALRWLRHGITPQDGSAGAAATADLDVAYLFPFPLDHFVAGGAISHIRGVVGGITENGRSCEVFAGSRLPCEGVPVHLIEARRRPCVLRGAVLLAYNRRFRLAVTRILRGRRPRVLYQRHGRFVIAGVLLSRALRVPLFLEYNGSESWMAVFWNPAPFKAWIRLCEEITLLGATRIIVVSEASRQEVLGRGVPPERVLLNPNAVDPRQFRPGCGGDEVRRQLGFAPGDIVVAFIGTFAYWHGIAVLQDAILQVLNRPDADSAGPPIRFLLIGQGVLYAGIHAALAEPERSGQVVFLGVVPHERVPAYLDAADMFVSPHVPMPDGRPFFGSPTKLFEYMAMGKAIVASRLDQLAEVLSDKETALLVPPGDAQALAGAIMLAASDPALRRRLGEGARQAALQRHTWAQNAARIWNAVEQSTSGRRGSKPDDTPPAAR
jgi:glycosyltransferase involved in cell wall biosynthesis